MSEVDEFQILYDGNRIRVLNLLGRIVGDQDAEDLSQIVFAKVAQALPQFRGEAQVSTWLYRIVMNVAIDWMRSRSMRDTSLTMRLSDERDEQRNESRSATPYVASQATPEQSLVHKDMHDCLRAEIGELTPEHQAVLVLGDLGGLTDQEVANILGITVGNAKVRRHRARQELRRAVEMRCDFYRQELSCAPNSPTCCSPDKSKHSDDPIR